MGVSILSAPPVIENPIRAELFGIERLEQHAESLAAAQAVIEAVEPRAAPAAAGRATTVACSASRIA